MSRNSRSYRKPLSFHDFTKRYDLGGDKTQKIEEVEEEEEEVGITVQTNAVSTPLVDSADVESDVRGSAPTTSFETDATSLPASAGAVDVQQTVSPSSRPRDLLAEANSFLNGIVPSLPQLSPPPSQAPVPLTQLPTAASSSTLAATSSISSRDPESPLNIHDILNRIQSLPPDQRAVVAAALRSQEASGTLSTTVRPRPPTSFKEGEDPDDARKVIKVPKKGPHQQAARDKQHAKTRTTGERSGATNIESEGPPEVNYDDNIVVVPPTAPRPQDEPATKTSSPPPGRNNYERDHRVKAKPRDPPSFGVSGQIYEDDRPISSHYTRGQEPVAREDWESRTRYLSPQEHHCPRDPGYDHQTSYSREQAGVQEASVREEVVSIHPSRRAVFDHPHDGPRHRYDDRARNRYDEDNGSGYSSGIYSRGGFTDRGVGRGHGRGRDRDRGGYGDGDERGEDYYPEAHGGYIEREGHRYESRPREEYRSGHHGGRDEWRGGTNVVGNRHRTRYETDDGYYERAHPRNTRGESYGYPLKRRYAGSPEPSLQPSPEPKALNSRRRDRAPPENTSAGLLVGILGPNTAARLGTSTASSTSARPTTSTSAIIPARPTTSAATIPNKLITSNDTTNDTSDDTTTVVTRETLSFKKRRVDPTNPPSRVPSSTPKRALPSWYINQDRYEPDYRINLKREEGDVWRAIKTNLELLLKFLNSPPQEPRDRRQRDLREPVWNELAAKDLRKALQEAPYTPVVAEWVAKLAPLFEEFVRPPVWRDWPDWEDLWLDAAYIYRLWRRGIYVTSIYRGMSKNGRSFDPAKEKWKKDWRVVGDNGLVVGQWWPKQLCLMYDGAHGSAEAGIAVHDELAVSVVLSGGHTGGEGYNDEDAGYEVKYCGTRGEHSGTEGKKGRITKSTQALFNSMEAGSPVRLFRSSKSKGKETGDRLWAPKEGFRYDGLYEVVNDGEECLEVETNWWRFTLRRKADQPRIRCEGLGKKPNSFDLLQLKYYSE